MSPGGFKPQAQQAVFPAIRQPSCAVFRRLRTELLLAFLRQEICVENLRQDTVSDHCVLKLRMVSPLFLCVRVCASMCVTDRQTDTHTHTHKHTGRHTHTHTHRHTTHTHTDTHTHTYTHTHRLSFE